MLQCLLHAGKPKHAGDAAKSGEFLGEFSWVEFDPMGVRGLKKYNYDDKVNLCTIEC